MSAPDSPPRISPPARAGILRNITWLGVGNAAVKPLWFLFITHYCITTLGDDGYGVMNWALYTMTIAAAFSDLGTTTYSIREVARDRTQASAFFSNLLAFRLGIGLALLGLVVLVGLLTAIPSPKLMALAAAGLYATGLITVSYCRTFYRAFEVLRFEALSLIFEKVLVIGGGMALLLLSGTPQGTLLGLAGGMTLALAWNVGWVHRRFAPFRAGLLSLSFLRSKLRAALPLGLFGLFVVFYVRIGPVLLEAMQGEAAVGQFSAAFRILEALVMLPAIVSAAVLPRLSRLFKEGRARDFGRLVRLSTGGTFLAALAIAVPLAVFSEPVIGLLSGGRPEFAPSADLLGLMAWAYPLMSVNGLLSVVMMATDEQRYLAATLGIISLVSLVANLLLIPHYAAFALCYVLLASEVLILAALLTRYLRRLRPARSASPH